MAALCSNSLAQVQLLADWRFFAAGHSDKVRYVQQTPAQFFAVQPLLLTNSLQRSL